MTARVAEMLSANISRGQLKRFATEIDAEPALRHAILQMRPDLPEEANHWPSKRLLRHARGRSEEAQQRSNPIARDEAFTCQHCGYAVRPHGRTARDHCPRCLRSLHVDIVPGDRAETCHGILDPVAVESLGSDAWKIIYRCRSCGAARANRAILDGDDPDDWAQIVRLTGDDHG